MEADAGMVNVAKYIIKKTPIGHLGKSIENLKILVGEQVLDTDEIKNELHSYGENHLSQVPNDITNTKVVISPLTKDADGYYVDQCKKVRFIIGLDSGAVENAEAYEVESELRDKLEVKLKAYLEENYKEGVPAYNIYHDATSNKLVLLISVHNLNLKNFWSGEWLSTWEADLSSLKINGTIKIGTYYYEEGNAQLLSENKFNGTLSGGNNDALAASLIEFVNETEKKYHLELEKVYDDLADVYIKPLRRKAQITGTKMNWSLNQVNLKD